MLVEALLCVALTANPEISGVQSLMELAGSQSARRAERGGDPVPTGLLLAAMAQGQALLERDGVPLDGAPEEWLRERLMKRLEAALWEMPSEPGPRRREAWEQLVREATTSRLAQQVIDEWLQLPPLVVPEEPPVTGHWKQATQLEGGELFALERVDVVGEVGSEGLQNQLIDPGEWVRLSVTFTNATKLPWFSTSAFPKASGCVWVDENRSSVVGEMAPGASASVLLWAYFPERCSEAATVRLGLADTHRGTPVGSFTLSLKPSFWTRPRISRLRLDTDALGSSDGSRLTQLAPSMRFELVADVHVAGDLVSTVVQRWSVPNSVRPFFKSLTFRDGAPAVPLGGGQFAAGDDLDGATVDADAWAALAQSEALERWMLVPASGRFWLAMDTTVVLTGAQPVPSTPPLVTPGGRKTRSSPTTVTPELSATAVAPTATSVAELVKRYVELTPHAVPRENPAAVQAVSGYEVLFDRSAFMKAYEALLAPPVAPVPAAEVSAARYVTRTYLAVPAVPVARPPPPPEPPAAPPARAPKSSPPPVVQTAPRTWVQLDVGGGVSIFGTQATSALPSLWGGASVIAFPTFSVRAFIGPHVVGVLAFQFVTLTYGLAGRATFTELSGDVGIGYRWTWAPLSLTPYAALLIRQRSHSRVAVDGGSIGGAIGLNGRLQIASWFGLALDLSVPLGLPGPYGLAGGVEVGVVGGVGLRATAQASVSF